MLLKEIIVESSSYPVPQLRVDNPGGRWLQGKREDSVNAGRDEYGAPESFGSVTGHFTSAVLIPVEKLTNVKGRRGEQKNVRQDDLNWLVDYMGEHNKLPPLSDNNDSEYAPFIQVDQDGEPWVNEGNHRIMAAAKLGWTHMPVEVRYFNGGEDAEGSFHPDVLLSDHSKLMTLPRK